MNQLRLWMRRKVRIGLVLATALLLGSIGINTVWASTTPVLCDPPFQKYGCTYVDYTVLDAGRTSQINFRAFKGARDGGAQQWQIFWVKDWQKEGAGYVFKEQWGPGSWRTDINFSPWFTIGPVRNRLRDAVVGFKFRYYEIDSSGTHYWCSDSETHYLINNTAVHAGGAACI